MPDSENTLSIVAKVQDQASDILDNIGSSGVAATEEVAAGMDKVAVSAENMGAKGTAAAEDTNKELSETEKLLKQLREETERNERLAEQNATKRKARWEARMAPIRASHKALAAFQKGVRSANKDVVGIGTDLLGAFASGGLVMGGIQAVATGVGLLVGKLKESRAEMKKMREEAIASADQLVEEYKRMAGDTSEFLTNIHEEAVAEHQKLVEANMRLRGAEYDAARVLEERHREQRKADLQEAITQSKLVVEERKKAVAEAASYTIKQEREALRQAENIYAARVQAYGHMVQTFATLDKRRAAEVTFEKQKEQREAEKKAAEERMSELRAEIKANNALVASENKRRQSLLESLETKVKIAQMTEEQQEYASQLLEIEEFRRDGLTRHLKIAEKLLKYDKARAAYQKAEAKYEVEKQKRADAQEKVEELNASIEHRLSLMKREADYGKEMVALYDKMQDMINKGADAALVDKLYKEEALRLVDTTISAEEKYLQQLEQQLEYARLTNDAERERYETMLRVIEAQKEGGEEAAEMMRELIQLEKQRTDEQKSQTSEAKKRNDQESQFSRLSSGGTMDKGLASRRQKRRARLHMRKRKRELAGRMGRNIGEGPGGIMFSGRGEEGLGSMSEWVQGPSEIEKEKARRLKKKQAEQAGLPKGLKMGDPEAPQMPEMPDLTPVTSDLNTKLEVLKTRMTNLKDAMEGAAGKLEDVNLTGDKSVTAIKDMKNNLAELTRGYSQIAEELSKANTDLGGSVLLNAEQLAKIRDDLNELRQALADAERLANG